MKILVNVDGHDDNLFSVCRCSQPVAYSANAGGLQNHTVSIALILLGVNFKQDVWKVVDAHVEVTSGTVHEILAGRFNHKVKRKQGITVASD